MKKILVLLGMTVVFTAYSQQKTALTEMDVAKLQAIPGSEISADGSKVAYIKTLRADPTKENSGIKLQLYVFDVATGQSTAFVIQNNMSSVRFRPDHNSITFLSRRAEDKTTGLYEIPLTGGEAQKIFSFSSSITGYDWHHDGEQLLFVSRITNKADSPLPYQPEIYEENLNASNAYLVTVNQGDAKQISKDVYVRQVAWNHGGDKIAYGGAPTALIDDSYTSQKIFIITADNISQGSEITHTAKLGTFKWSPDDKRIAFIAGKDKHDPIAGRLLVADAVGSEPKLINEDFKGSFDRIIWQDNKNIMFLASEGVDSYIGTISLSGKINKVVEKSAVSISSFSLANNGTISLTGSTAMHPSELFLRTESSKTLNRITNTNPWLDNKLMGKQEVVDYKAADGLDIQGILISPAIPVSGKVPMITVVHGGPEAHYDNAWLTGYSSPGQMAAGQGYAVFYPNYRGSTGRGIEFAESSQGDPAGKEFDDIIDGIDYLIENNNIDKAKVGVTGGSYGGYATGWMSTRHTDRFAAGVMFVGISNNLSKWGTSDIPEEMYLVHSRKRIWDDYQFFLERSPIYYAGQAKTPLLIMAGKEDTRVDPGQSYELYRHIKTRTDTPVRLVLYPGEGHGNRNSTARFDYSLRMMRWFDTYLKNDDNKIPETEISIETGGN